jgi:hypothetical protein
MARMGPIRSFLFKDRWDTRGWAFLPSRMSVAEVGFLVLATYEIGRWVLIWVKS